MTAQFRHYKYFLLTLAVIAIDQTVKLLVHFKMVFGQSGEIKVFGDWFKLHYILNEGMAFGLRFGSEWGKLGLTAFRMVAMTFIAIYLYKLAKKNLKPGLLWTIALILGGAMGNVIDSIFYGVYLNNAPYDAVTPWFHGKVVDMFYLDVWEGYIADWVPLWGGKYIALWPIFNVADVCIFLGIALLLIFQKRFFNRPATIQKEITIE
ncbi:lipoprotein signal peptidase [Roseivirga echinicomitans]|uniref:Lipoprotein signal peptidase n=1 Tax=Roseivirga echinicomitans TaxID=296218 RepID=A0A150XYP2_9BACT|nr:lipoprotein signal peptidase [Roseivirga echinicomitans]KYG83782.1 signal peptidase [Roseivirga echinicomitans]